MSTPTEDKDLEDYLRRKSALSLGYKNLFIESPSPELDRAIAARARRSLRWLVPMVVAIVIGVSMAVGVNLAILNLMDVSVKAEKNANRVRQERAAELERERASQPIGVMIDAKNIAKQEAKDAAERVKAEQAAREQAVTTIEALKRAGKQKEADAELRRFLQAYPESAKL